VRSQITEKQRYRKFSLSNTQVYHIKSNQVKVKVNRQLRLIQLLFFSSPLLAPPLHFHSSTLKAQPPQPHLNTPYRFFVLAF
jgi:hypothetical protein